VTRALLIRDLVIFNDALNDLTSESVPCARKQLEYLPPCMYLPVMSQMR